MEFTGRQEHESWLLLSSLHKTDSNYFISRSTDPQFGIVTFFFTLVGTVRVTEHHC